MPRKLLVSVIVLLGLSIGIILLMGMSPMGSLLTNFLQIVCCGLAAGMCFAAAKRGRGISRPFWILVGCSIAAWGVANLGWMYYENWLHQTVPRFSVVRILFDVQGVFTQSHYFWIKKEIRRNLTPRSFWIPYPLASFFCRCFSGFSTCRCWRGRRGASTSWL